MNREAWFEPQHVLVGVNWPVLSGCMADACAIDQQTPPDPVICERGSVTDLCEVTVHRPEGLQGQCEVLCSARTCEVYEQKDNESTSYVSTVRGKPKAGAFEHCLTLPAATKAILRLLSLQQRGIVHIYRVQLAAVSEVGPHQLPSAADSRPSDQHSSQSSSRSQQAEVKAMLQDLMSTGPPGSVTSPADTHQKFMAALAKAALAQDKSKPSHRLFQRTHQQQPLAVQDVAQSSQASGLAKQSPAPSLIQELPETDLSEEKKEATQTQPLIQEMSSAAATPDQPHKDQQELSIDQDISNEQQLSSRVQALEAASRRMERKIDQILQYCRVMTQSMAPVS